MTVPPELPNPKRFKSNSVDLSPCPTVANVDMKEKVAVLSSSSSLQAYSNYKSPSPRSRQQAVQWEMCVLNELMHEMETEGSRVNPSAAPGGTSAQVRPSKAHEEAGLLIRGIQDPAKLFSATEKYMVKDEAPGCLVVSVMIFRRLWEMVEEGKSVRDIAGLNRGLLSVAKKGTLLEFTSAELVLAAKVGRATRHAPLLRQVALVAVAWSSGTIRGPQLTCPDLAALATIFSFGEGTDAELKLVAMDKDYLTSLLGKTEIEDSTPFNVGGAIETAQGIDIKGLPRIEQGRSILCTLVTALCRGALAVFLSFDALGLARFVCGIHIALTGAKECKETIYVQEVHRKITTAILKQHKLDEKAGKGESAEDREDSLGFGLPLDRQSLLLFTVVFRLKLAVKNGAKISTGGDDVSAQSITASPSTPDEQLFVALASKFSRLVGQMTGEDLEVYPASVYCTTLPMSPAALQCKRSLLLGVADQLEKRGQSDFGEVTLDSLGGISYRGLVQLAGAVEKVQLTCPPLARIVNREWLAEPQRFQQVRDTSEVALCVWRAPEAAGDFLSRLTSWVMVNMENEQLCRPRTLWQYLRALSVAPRDIVSDEMLRELINRTIPTTLAYKHGRDVDFQILGLVVGGELVERLRPSSAPPLSIFWPLLIDICLQKKYPVVIAGFLEAMADCGFVDERLIDKRAFNRIDPPDAKEIGHVTALTGSPTMSSFCRRLLLEKSSVLVQLDVLWSVLSGLAVARTSGNVTDAQAFEMAENGPLETLIGTSAKVDALLQTPKPSQQTKYITLRALFSDQVLGKSLAIQHAFRALDLQLRNETSLKPLDIAFCAERAKRRSLTVIQDIQKILCYRLGVGRTLPRAYYLVSPGLVADVAFPARKGAILLESNPLRDNANVQRVRLSGYGRLRENLIVQQGWKVLTLFQGQKDAEKALEKFLGVLELEPERSLIVNIRGYQEKADPAAFQSILKPQGARVKAVVCSPEFPLGGLAASRMLYWLVKKEIKMSTLDLSGQHLDDQSVEVICEFIVTNGALFRGGEEGKEQKTDVSLKKLDLSNNNLSLSGIECIVKAMSDTKHISLPRPPMQLAVFPGNEKVLSDLQSASHLVSLLAPSFSPSPLSLSQYCEHRLGIPTMEVTSNLEKLIAAWEIDPSVSPDVIFLKGQKIKINTEKSTKKSEKIEKNTEKNIEKEIKGEKEGNSSNSTPQTPN